MPLETREASGDLPQPIPAVIEAAGGSTEDAEILFGTAGATQMMIARLPGVDADALRGALTEVGRAPSEETVGDKEVLTEQAGTNGVIYHYFFDDVWFNMFTADPAVAEEVLEELP